MMGLPVRRIQETVAATAMLEVSVEAIQGLLEASAESLSPDYEAIHRMVLRAGPRVGRVAGLPAGPATLCSGLGRTVKLLGGWRRGIEGGRAVP